MIIDEAIALAPKHSNFLHPTVLKRVTAAARQAHRLVLDENSSRLMGRFMTDCIDLIIQNRQFAVPLYDVMYIEYDTQAMYKEVKGFAAGPISLEDPVADQRVGFLFDHRTVYTVANGPLSTSIMPLFNYINPRGSYSVPFYGADLPAYELFADSKQVVPNPYAKLSLMLGTNSLRELTGLPDGATLTDITADLLALSEEVQYYFGGRKSVEFLSVESHQRMLQESVGDVRNIYTILLWLNSLPHTVKYTNMPAGARLVRGKRVAMAAHNVVTIHMKGTVQIRNLWQKHIKAREHPRRHDVRGFWRHRGGIPQGCGHIWPATPDKRHKFVCAKCQRERWWVHEHQRGDISKGFVTKDYRAEI